MNPIVDEIKQHNANVELLYVSFLNNQGKLTKKHHGATIAKFLFADGKDIELPITDLHFFDDFEFKIKSLKRNSNET